MSILSIGELLDMGNSAATAGLIPYSAIEYNASGDISGISGSAIAGGVDTTIVSSIVSSYVESGVSGKVDQTAFDECCSAMSAVVSAKLDASASSQFQPSGNYQPSGDYYSATNPSGFITTADITGKLDITASSLFQPSGDYADSSSLSGKLDASASGQFQPSGSYAYNSSLSSYIPFSAVSGESNQITAINGSAIGNGGGGEPFTGVVTDDTLTGNGLPNSALGVDGYGILFDSSLYSSLDGDNVTIGVQTGIYATTDYVDSSVSGKQDTLTFAYDDDKISSINGSALAGGGGGGDLRVASPSGTILVTNGTSIEGTNSAIGSGVKSAVNVIESASTTISSLTAYASASSQISVTSPSAYGLGICYESSNIGRSVNIIAHYSGYTTASAILEIPGSSTSAGVLIGNKTAKITGVGIKAGNRSITLSGSYPILLCEPAVSVRELVCLDELSSYVNIKPKTTIEYGINAFASGTNTIAIGTQASAINAGSIAFGDHTKADFFSFAIGNDCVAEGRSIAWGSATATVSSTAIGHGISAINRSIVLGYLNNSGNGAGDSGVALAIGDGTASTARHDLMVVTKNGEITMYSSTADTVGTGVMDSIRSLSAAVSGVTALLDAI